MTKIRLRPKWTLGTMLLIVGWSAVVVWLNVRPRIGKTWTYTHPPSAYEERWAVFVYGCPFTSASVVQVGEQSQLPRFCFEYTDGYWLLAFNIAIGLLAVFILTWASKYLLRAITAALRAFVGKPPPADVDGD